eukprot:c11793_g3_i1 orf=115-336(+)
MGWTMALFSMHPIDSSSMARKQVNFFGHRKYISHSYEGGKYKQGKQVWLELWIVHVLCRQQVAKCSHRQLDSL